MISANDILSVTKNVTKEWEKQRKAEERGSRSVSSRRYIYSNRVAFTEVVDRILPAAYAHASKGDGGIEYTVAKRQFFYAVRKPFFEMTGREITSARFGTILLQYMNRNPQKTATWKVTADPRGTLTLPNTSHEVRVPCGTLAIEEHLRKARQTIDPLDSPSLLPTEWPSLAEGVRYQAVLYIEKEGFEPLLREARIAERFDLAILSCKGQSVVAGRRYCDHVCRVNGGIPLFAAHDLDKAGFEIVELLTKVSECARDQDRVAYEFQNDINVHDLGLRLVDAEKYDLETEEVQFNGRHDWNRDGFCTPEEEAFLRSDRRVELNAFTSPQFIEWLESKLTEHLPSRLVPDDETLIDAYRRAMVVAEINAAIDAATDSATEKAREATVPKTLRRMLKKKMKDSPAAWDEALYAMVKSKLYLDDED